MCFHSEGRKQARPHSWVFRMRSEPGPHQQAFPHPSQSKAPGQVYIPQLHWLCVWHAGKKSNAELWKRVRRANGSVSSFRFVLSNILYIPSESELKDSSSSGPRDTQQAQQLHKGTIWAGKRCYLGQNTSTLGVRLHFFFLGFVVQHYETQCCFKTVIAVLRLFLLLHDFCFT